MNTITFRVHGTPATQGSKRHVGRGVMVEMNKKLPAWRKAIIAAGTQVAPKRPLDCPVSVETTIWVPRDLRNPDLTCQRPQETSTST